MRTNVCIYEYNLSQLQVESLASGGSAERSKMVLPVRAANTKRERENGAPVVPIKETETEEENCAPCACR